ncbi:MAG: DNA mismatch repair protein MutS, partial [Syntrophomonadaceae bacterium]|nr:DNA mismatch repair protein MutS [Syntrophomonadaceae bacterium]
VNTSTSRSLIILDEVGRGTSTFDGLSLAWALVEYLHNRVGARCLFTTHYHQLTGLEEVLPGVRNFSVAVKEHGHDIVFLHKVLPGGSDRSYGIQVARLAGLPPELIGRASKILEELEEREAALNLAILKRDAPRPARGVREGRHQREKTMPSPRQISLVELDAHPLLEQIRHLNLIETTPLEALRILFEIQKKIKNLA